MVRVDTSYINLSMEKFPVGNHIQYGIFLQENPGWEARACDAAALLELILRTRGHRERGTIIDGKTKEKRELARFLLARSPLGWDAFASGPSAVSWTYIQVVF